MLAVPVRVRQAVPVAMRGRTYVPVVVPDNGGEFVVRGQARRVGGFATKAGPVVGDGQVGLADGGSEPIGTGDAGATGAGGPGTGGDGIPADAGSTTQLTQATDAGALDETPIVPEGYEVWEGDGDSSGLWGLALVDLPDGGTGEVVAPQPVDAGFGGGTTSPDAGEGDEREPTREVDASVPAGNCDQVRTSQAFMDFLAAIATLQQEAQQLGNCVETQMCVVYQTPSNTCYGIEMGRNGGALVELEFAVQSRFQALNDSERQCVNSTVAQCPPAYVCVNNQCAPTAP